MNNAEGHMEYSDPHGRDCDPNDCTIRVKARSFEAPPQAGKSGEDNTQLEQTMSLAEQYVHLVEVAREYRELVQLTERGALEAEEQRILLSQRSVVHDQLIALFEQLKIPFVDREDVRRQAMDIAARGQVWP